MDITSWKSKVVRMLCSCVTGRKQTDAPSEVKSFNDHQKKEAAFDARDRGIRTVPMSRIVGSVGRYQDFDSRFRFKHNMPSERLQWIMEAMRQGRPLGPVKLYQIKDDYYVLDGNETGNNRFHPDERTTKKSV